VTDTGWLWPNSVITNVVDGDTFDARVRRDMGFGGVVEFVVRLRLNRINAPAKSTPAGAAARMALAPLVDGQFLIETVKPYKYGGPGSSPGEWMAEVTLPSGVNLSDWLVSQGHAIPWDGTGTRPEAA
jgi:endonuclease YncB( thermonuclease family)